MMLFIWQISTSKISKEFGFINEDGDEVISCKYEEACDFSERIGKSKPPKTVGASSMKMEKK